jgi:hypothetical protein
MGLFKKKKVNSLSPFDLDWGEITPDIYNGETNEAFHICNHYHISEEGRNISRIFTSGRVVWYHPHLPKKSSHHIRLDIRGQNEISFEIEQHREWKKQVQIAVSRKDKIELEIDFTV